MGLIKAATAAVGTQLADQWKEYFACESLDKDVLMTKGSKIVSGKSSNTNGSDNIITNGSVIAVADGQCMIIVEQGKVVDICAEPGAYTFDQSTEPSVFSGNLGQSIVESFKTMGKRFTFGGDTGKDQRVYYFNTKEILDNKFGTQNPIPFKVRDDDTGFSLTIDVRCNGVYSYRITDPIAFYAHVVGNVATEYRRSEIDTQLKTEFISALTPAFAELSAKKIPVETLASHNGELKDAVNNALLSEWQSRGLTIEKIAINPISLSEEDKKKLNQAQTATFYSNAANAAGMMAVSQAAALENASSNQNGAMAGFMGMGMAMNAGGMNAGQLFQQAAANQQAAQQAQFQQQAQPQAQAVVGAGAAVQGWTCPTCGTVNQGKFCQNCGGKKPAGAPLYKCDKCGWVPEDPTNPPKFCPECGDPFDDNDVQ